MENQRFSIHRLTGFGIRRNWKVINRANTLNTLTFFLTLISSHAIVLGMKKDVECASTDWPPYYSSKLPDKGGVTVLAAEIFKAAGYNLKVKWLPWKRALKITENGFYPCILGVYYTEERNKNFIYPKYSLGNSQSVLITIKDRGKKKKILNLKELQGSKISYLRGTSVSEEFDSASYLNKWPVGTEIQGLKMLIKGRVDYYTGNLLVSMNIIYNDVFFKKSKDKFLVVSPYLAKNELFVAFSRRSENSTKLRENFEKGWEYINKNGVFKAIKNDYPFLFSK